MVIAGYQGHRWSSRAQLVINSATGHQGRSWSSRALLVIKSPTGYQGRCWPCHIWPGGQGPMYAESKRLCARSRMCYQRGRRRRCQRTNMNLGFSKQLKEFIARRLVIHPSRRIRNGEVICVYQRHQEQYPLGRVKMVVHVPRIGEGRKQFSPNF